MKEQLKEIEVFVRARYPYIYVVTYEEERVEELFSFIAKTRGKTLYTWSCTQGLVDKSSARQDHGKNKDPLAALEAIHAITDSALFLMYDFHPYIHDHSIVRKLRELSLSLKTSFRNVVFISPVLKIPTELEKDIVVVDFELPTVNELEVLLNRIITEITQNPKVQVLLDPDTKEKMLHAARGLTLKEAENVFAKALVSNARLDAEDIPIILSEKKQIIRKSGMLEYYEASESMQDVGGLETLKDWLEKRGLAFSERARTFGLPAPKGILLIGVQGCGKSLCAKAVSQLWSLPLLRLDVGKIFSSLVGSSEENTRKAMQVCESVAPCILWVDEIEKAFSGVQSSNFSDAGTMARVFGYFITWLQEKKSAVFVVATANNISQLPPELMRKGRFDEIFFVDLPEENERKDIFKIHLLKRKKDAEKFDLKACARASEGFSGAEIEQAIISALFDAFYKNSELTTELLLENLHQSVPLSKTMEEDIQRIRQWAEGRARYASLKEGKPITSPQGKTRALEMEG